MNSLSSGLFVVRDGEYVTGKLRMERGAILVNDKPLGGR